MTTPPTPGGKSKATKIGTLLWSVALSVGVIVLGASIMLPSTKSSRIFTPPRDTSDQPPEGDRSTAADPVATKPVDHPPMLSGSKSGILIRPKAADAAISAAEEPAPTSPSATTGYKLDNSLTPDFAVLADMCSPPSTQPAPAP